MDATGLRADLHDSSPDDVVRLVADWIDRALRSTSLDLTREPEYLGTLHLDAIIAAAAAHVARLKGQPTPEWAIEPGRFCQSFWYPGPAALFPNALVHAPGEFAIRGVFIEEASLQCV